MRISYYCRSCIMAAAVFFLMAPSTRAAEVIGDAVGVTPAAAGTISGELGVNLPVYRGETVRTGPTGVLEIRFLDQTRLQLGPSATVKLDNFVYTGNGQVQDMILSISKGMFRFATGVSPKKAYWIRTPQAGVGGRGTDFAGEVTPTSLRLTLNEGEIKICGAIKGESASRARQRNCPVLRRPGETVTVFQDGRIVIGGAAVKLSSACAETSGGSQLCSGYGSGARQKHDTTTPAFNFPVSPERQPPPVASPPVTAPPVASTPAPSPEIPAGLTPSEPETPVTPPGDGDVGDKEGGDQGDGGQDNGGKDNGGLLGDGSGNGGRHNGGWNNGGRGNGGHGNNGWNNNGRGNNGWNNGGRNNGNRPPQIRP